VVAAETPPVMPERGSSTNEAAEGKSGRSGASRRRPSGVRKNFATNGVQRSREFLLRAELCSAGSERRRAKVSQG